MNEPRSDVVARLAAWVEESETGAPGALFVVLAGAPQVGRSIVLAGLRPGGPATDVRRARGVPWEEAAPGSLLTQLLPEVAPHVTAHPVATAHAVAERLHASDHDGPVVLLVDDADLADAFSVRALASTVRLHRDLRLLVVATRTTGRASAAADVLDRVGDRSLELPPLDAAAVVAFAARAGIVLHESLAEHLTAHTAGRPAHVAALLADEPRGTWRGLTPTLGAPGPVLNDTRRRTAAAGPEAVALARAVAVLGTPAPLALASAVAEVDDTLAALEQAEGLGLLRRRGAGAEGMVSLPDTMVAAAVRALMGPTEECRLHRRAAACVDDEAQRLEHTAAASLAPDAPLADEIHALARSRAAEGAWRSAAGLFLLAGRCSTTSRARDERLLLAVDALVGAGDLPAATSYLSEVESLPETAMRNAVLGYLAILRGRAGEAESRLARAWNLERGDRHPDVAATIAQRHVLHHLARCDGASLVTWADRAVDLVGRDHPTAVEAQAIRGLGLGSTGRLPEALDSYRSLWGHASRGAVGQRVQMGSGWLDLVADDVDRARVALTTAVPTDYLGGSTRISLWAQAWLARTHFVTGEWDQAVLVAATALDVAERSGIALLEPLLRWTTAQVQALRGQDDPTITTERSPGPGSDYEVMWVPSCLARAAVAEARADYAGVLAALGPLTRPGVSPDLAEPGFWPWPDVYANALVVEGDLEAAGSFLDQHEALARDRGHRSAAARLGYARGRLLGAQGDLPGARRSFERSLELLEGLPLVYDRARVNFAYGQTLRRAGKRRDADVVVTAAREDYARLGATTYVLRCDRELKAGGVRADLRDRPAESLTPQERAVAGLVIQGLRNREVAAELFLSVKTVQFHLTRVYAKLGVRSRVELATLHPDRYAPDTHERQAR